MPEHNSWYHLFCSLVASEDSHSVDLGFRVDIEEKGFYTENFHSAAWVFRGDDGNPEDSPRCLSKKPRPVAGKDSTITVKCVCLRESVTSSRQVSEAANIYTECTIWIEVFVFLYNIFLNIVKESEAIIIKTVLITHSNIE